MADQMLKHAEALMAPSKGYAELWEVVHGGREAMPKDMIFAPVIGSPNALPQPKLLLQSGGPFRLVVRLINSSLNPQQAHDATDGKSGLTNALDIRGPVTIPVQAFQNHMDGAFYAVVVDASGELERQRR